MKEIKMISWGEEEETLQSNNRKNKELEGIRGENGKKRYMSEHG